MRKVTGKDAEEEAGMLVERAVRRLSRPTGRKQADKLFEIIPVPQRPGGKKRESRPPAVLGGASCSPGRGLHGAGLTPRDIREITRGGVGGWCGES